MRRRSDVDCFVRFVFPSGLNAQVGATLCQLSKNYFTRRMLLCRRYVPCCSNWFKKCSSSAKLSVAYTI